MRKISKKETGITLIALIITIVVMLILVVVSIQIALETGLFESAGKATKNWEEAQANEGQLGNGKVNVGGTVYNSVDEYIIELGKEEEIHNWTRNGDIVTCTHCSTILTIGEQLNYKKTGNGSSIINGAESGVSLALDDGNLEVDEKIGADGSQTIIKDTDTKWVVLGIEDQNKNGTKETLLITTLKPTEDVFYMYGAAEYNNGVNIINRVCKELYGEEARGMTIEDVNNCLAYTPEGGSYYAGAGSFRNTGDFKTKLKELDDVWGGILSSGTYTPDGENTEEALGEYILDGYDYEISDDGTYIEEDFDEDDKSNIITAKARDLIFVSDVYMLASRGVRVWECDDVWALFGVYRVGGSSIDVEEMFTSCWRQYGGKLCRCSTGNSSKS